MSAVSDCQCACPDPTVVEIPGAPGTDGAAGAAGADGINAFTVTTGALVIPTSPTTVTIAVGVSSWAGIDQIVFISDGTHKAHFKVTAIPSSTSLTLVPVSYTDDNPAGDTISSGATVSPSGTQPAFTPPTPLTDSTLGTAGATLAAGVGLTTITIPLTSLATGLSTSAIDLLTDYVPGYAFRLISFDFVTTVAGTGAGASQVFNLAIGATPVTNTLTVTLASTATIGAVTNGSPATIVAANVGTAANALSIEMAAGGTVFTAGAGYFVIKLANLDTANAIASLNSSIDDIITQLS